MSDSVAWCILAGFKITSVFARITYHTIESMCEFAVSILQGYIYGGKKSVNVNVAKKTNQRKRKSIRPIEDESRKAEEPKNKNFNGKTNESIMSKSTHMAKDMQTISEQRFCFHGTDKIMECNLRDARKVTVSFDFYPSRNRSMIEFFDSSSYGATDHQKKVVENGDSSEKSEVSTDKKQTNGQLNQNDIARNECRIKYKDEAKLTDETIFITDSNMHATKNVLEVASDGRDVSINGCGTLYKKDGEEFSDEQHLEPSVVHLSQDPESLVDKRVTHEKVSLDSADEEWQDNDTVGKRQKQEISFDHSSDKKQDTTIFVDGETRATTTIHQRYIANGPEHSGKNQTTPYIEEKQIQETLSEKQRSGSKDILIHSEQDRIPSEPAPITLPASDTDKLVPEYLADKNKKLLTESTTDKNNRYEPESPLEAIPPLEASEKSVSASAVDKKSTPECPVNKDTKHVPLPTVNKLTPVSPANKDKSVPAADKKLIPSPETGEKPVSASAVDKKSTSECPANSDKKNVPVPTEDKKLTPQSPTKKDKKVVSEPISQKNESSPVSLAKQNRDYKINMTIPESTIDKHIPASAIDGKPISAADDCYPVENLSEVAEKLEVREINEDGNGDSSLTKESSSQTKSIDPDSYDEEISGDFNEMLEKGPSIVIAPDILLNPNMGTYHSGIFRPDISKTKMNSKYLQDGWDDSDKCFLDYVIEREEEMGQFDPSAFKNECSNEIARSDEIKSKDENIQRDSYMYGKIIDKYNPLMEVPKYYDLISVADSKYVLEKSRIKCYKKKEVTDNFASAEGTNTDDPNVLSKEQRSTFHQHNTERQSTGESENANFIERTSGFGESSVTLQESQKNVKTYKEMGARPKTSRGARK